MFRVLTAAVLAVLVSAVPAANPRGFGEAVAQSAPASSDPVRTAGFAREGADLRGQMTVLAAGAACGILDRDATWPVAQAISDDAERLSTRWFGDGGAMGREMAASAAARGARVATPETCAKWRRDPAIMRQFKTVGAQAKAGR